jgi:hypothetical protein
VRLFTSARVPQTGCCYLIITFASIKNNKIITQQETKKPEQIGFVPAFAFSAS